LAQLVRQRVALVRQLGQQLVDQPLTRIPVQLADRPPKPRATDGLIDHVLRQAPPGRSRHEAPRAGRAAGEELRSPSGLAALPAGAAQGLPLLQPQVLARSCSCGHETPVRSCLHRSCDTPTAAGTSTAPALIVNAGALRAIATTPRRTPATWSARPSCATARATPARRAPAPTDQPPTRG